MNLKCCFCREDAVIAEQLTAVQFTLEHVLLPVCKLHANERVLAGAAGFRELPTDFSRTVLQPARGPDEVVPDGLPPKMHDPANSDCPLNNTLLSVDETGPRCMCLFKPLAAPAKCAHGDSLPCAQCDANRRWNEAAARIRAADNKAAMCGCGGLCDSGLPCPMPKPLAAPPHLTGTPPNYPELFEAFDKALQTPRNDLRDWGPCKPNSGAPATEPSMMLVWCRHKLCQGVVTVSRESPPETPLCEKCIGTLGAKPESPKSAYVPTPSTCRQLDRN